MANIYYFMLTKLCVVHKPCEWYSVDLPLGFQELKAFMSNGHCLCKNILRLLCSRANRMPFVMTRAMRVWYHHCFIILLWWGGWELYDISAPTLDFNPTYLKRIINKPSCSEEQVVASPASMATTRRIRIWRIIAIPHTLHKYSDINCILLMPAIRMQRFQQQ